MNMVIYEAGSQNLSEISPDVGGGGLDIDGYTATTEAV